jgi:VWFA-related protein
MQEHFKRTSVNPYAELSGGEMTAAGKETINTRLGEMIERLRSRYSLGYAPTDQDFNGKFRRVRLALTAEAKKRLNAEVVIGARQGYYAIDKETEALLAENSAPASAALSPNNPGPDTADPKNAKSDGAAARLKSDSPTANARSVDQGAAAIGGAESPPAGAGDANAGARPTQPDPSDPKTANSPESSPAAASRPRRVSAEDAASPLAGLVMLDVVAVNKKTGAIVKDLRSDDFEIEDNGAKRTITHFSRGETPLSVVLLVDVAGNTGYALSSLRRSVRHWMGKLNPDDEVALMAFGGNAVLIQNFTNDRKRIAVKLRNFLEEARKQNLAPSAPYAGRTNALFQAAEQLDITANPLSRRAIVVVTDDRRSFEGGKPDFVAERVLGSGTSVYALVAKGSDGSGKGKVTRAVVESAIYSFGNPASFAINLGTRIGTEAALNAILNDRSFGRVVVRSGGSMARADGDETSERLASLLDQLRNRYVVGFAPPPHTSGDRFHKLNLKLAPQAKKRGEEVAVVTAQGYFAHKTN